MTNGAWAATYLDRRFSFESSMLLPRRRRGATAPDAVHEAPAADDKPAKKGWSAQNALSGRAPKKLAQPPEKRILRQTVRLQAGRPRAHAAQTASRA